MASDWFALPDDPAASVWAAVEACGDSLVGCDTILVEGGPTTPSAVDATVFVAPPLGGGETLSDRAEKGSPQPSRRLETAGLAASSKRSSYAGSELAPSTSGGEYATVRP